METGLARHNARFDDVDRRLGGTRRTRESTNTGVQGFLRREAARPQPTSLRAVLATALALMGDISMLATFSW